MDIHERQSSAPAERWRAFQFSMLVVCVLGVLGNTSSLVVLARYLQEIAGSRLLLALAVADLGVVTSVASRTLAYSTYGNTQLTQVIDWWFIFCYYCSVYFTVLLSLDRYLHTAKPMLLLRLNYHLLLKRVILVVFGVMLVITLPHLLGNFVEYHHSSHTARADFCPPKEFCNSTSIPDTHHLSFCDQHRKQKSLSLTEEQVYTQLKSKMCAQDMNYTVYKKCHIPAVSIPATKFKPSINALFQFVHFGVKLKRRLKVTVCSVAATAMKYDPDFVKAVYLGLDLPLRYAIPCCTLAVLNIALVVTVRRAQQRHSDISQTVKKSLLRLPALRSALGIVFVFLICHTGGAGLFVLRAFRVFARPSKGLVGTTVNVFMGDSMANTGLEMKYSALLLAAVNSSINIVIYCLFLPSFRRRWKSLFICHVRGSCKSKTGPKAREPTYIIPLAEIDLSGPKDVSSGTHTICKYIYIPLSVMV